MTKNTLFAFLTVAVFGLMGTSEAATATTLSDMQTLAASNAVAMARMAAVHLTGYVKGSSKGAGDFAWDMSYASQPDGGVAIAPSDHSGSCAAGCMVRKGDLRTVSPLWWGAKVDGKSDDRGAFQAAINFAASQGGGTVSVPVGSSYIGYGPYMQADGHTQYGEVGFELASHVNLIGTGPASRLVCKNDFGQGAFYACIRGKSSNYGLDNSEIANFAMDGGNTPGTPGQLSGILIAGGTADNIHDLLVSRFAQQGIQVIGTSYGSHASDLSSNRVSGFSDLDASTVKIGAVLLGTGISPGTTVTAVGQNVLTVSSAMPRANGAVVGIIGPPRQLRIHHNHLTQIGYIAIQVQYPFDAVISQNVVDGAGENCIDLYGDNGTLVPTSRNWTVTANSVTHCGGQGIFPETVTDGKVTGNTVSNSNSGVWINQMHGHPNNISVSGNTFRQVAICAHITADGTEGIVITGNDCDGFTNMGLDLSGSGFRITGNSFSNSAPGVPIYGINHVHYSQVTGNRGSNIGHGIRYAGENGGNEITLP